MRRRDWRRLFRVARAQIAVALAMTLRVVADDASEPPTLPFGLFDFSVFNNASSSTNSTGGSFGGYLEALSQLARGEPGTITASFIEAALQASVDGTSGDSLFLRGDNVTSTDVDVQRMRRRAFSSLFDAALFVTSQSIQSTIDPSSLSGSRASERIEEATTEAREFASMILDADSEEEKRDAALALYDRVAQSLLHTRQILRRAAAAQSEAELATEANALFSASGVPAYLRNGGSFTEENSHWYVTSATARLSSAHDAGANADAGASNERRTASAAASAVGCLLVALGAGVAAFRRRRRSKKSIDDADADPSVRSSDGKIILTQSDHALRDVL